MSRVALIGDNSIEYIDTLLSIWSDGDCAVLIDCRIPFETAYSMMIEADVRKCFIDRRFLGKIDVSEYTSIEFIPFNSTGNTTMLLPDSIRKKYNQNYSRGEAVVIYSSGTTGKSKGIILSHYAISTNADSILDYMDLSDKDCIYISKPLVHSSTLVGELLTALKSGADIIVAPVIVPPRVILNNISKYGVTVICLNPHLMKLCSDEIQRKKYDVSSLKAIYVSGSIFSDKLYSFAHDVFRDIPVYNVYGLSEAGPRVTAQRSECCKSNSVGKPINGVEIAVVDNNGTVVTVGEKGLVHVGTPSLFSGYVSGNIKHESLYKDWLNTGDIGYIDENEELHIVDRADDMIIIDSHKVYPSEIEKIILNINRITDCTVTVVKNGDKEVIGCLYVSEIQIEDLKKRLMGILPVYEIPHILFRVQVLPRNNNGKILKSKVQELLLKHLNKENRV